MAGQEFLCRLLGNYMASEDPETVGLILSQMDPKIAAGVVDVLPAKMQGEALSHLASGNFDRSHCAPVMSILVEELLAGSGGARAAADIINRTGPSTEVNVLQHMDAADRDLAEDVRNQMFTFDDIARLTDREIQVLLRELEEKEVALALKGGSEEVKERFLSNMSEDARSSVEEQMKFSGPVRYSDAEEAQLRAVQTVRQLEEAGKVTIVRGESADTFL